jgi:ABC-type Fe3+/spermidine/putrescine transport system ATPase subunit
VNNELVSADGKIIIAPHKRETGFIFQDLALWPHFTVYENIAFGLKERKQKNISGEVAQILDIFGIGSKVRKFQHELSGGQKQMVDIARSVVLKPKILLMDEPLANIDEIIKNKIIIHLQQLREAQPFTIIYVTHDHNEAVQWGDNFVIMQQGKLIESGKTSEKLQAKYLFIK